MRSTSASSRESAAEFISRKKLEFTTELREGERVRFKDIGREGWHLAIREAWTLMGQVDLAEDKIFVVERFRWDGSEGKVHFPGASGTVTYRIGYWIRTATGRWWWGQYCPLPQEDLDKLLEQARNDKTLV